MTGTTDTSTERDALIERLMRATAGTFELCTVYLGDRLGLYRALGGVTQPPRRRWRGALA